MVGGDQGGDDREALHPRVAQSVDPFAQCRIGKWSVSETVWRRCPLTTSRTAWARRNPRASLVCFKNVSKVGRAHRESEVLRVRIVGVSRKNY